MFEDGSGDVWEESSGHGAFNSNSVASENLTINCAARNIQGPTSLPYSATLTTFMRMFLFTYLPVLLLAGAILSFLVMVLVVVRDKLKTFVFGIALQVMVIDWTLLLLVLVRLISVASNQWVFGERMCALVGMLLDVFTTQRLFLMSVLVSNRILCVFRPQLYLKLRLKVAVGFSIASWLLPVVIYTPSLALDCYTFLPNLWSCGVSYDCSDACAKYNRTVFGLFLIPVRITTAVSYFVVYRKAKKAVKDEGNVEFHEYYQHELKSTRTFLLFHVLFAMMNAPRSIIEFVSDNFYDGSELPAVLYVVATLAGAVILSLVVIDPIIMLQHPDMRTAITSCLTRERVYRIDSIALSSLESD